MKEIEVMAKDGQTKILLHQRAQDKLILELEEVLLKVNLEVVPEQEELLEREDKHKNLKCHILSSS